MARYPQTAASLFPSMQYKTFKLVYRRYAGLYFLLCVDVTDNELLYLETVHLFVEVRKCLWRLSLWYLNYFCCRSAVSSSRDHRLPLV